MKMFTFFVWIFILIFMFPGPFADAASDTEAPTDCCLPVLEKEVLPLEAKIHLEPGESGGFFPSPPEPRPSKKIGRPVEKDNRIWDENNYDRKDRWTIEDTFFQTQYALLSILDWGQTRYIADSDEFYEMNPILGAQPEKGMVDLYFSVTLIAHTAISYALPEKWRRKWQVFWIGLESFVTASNSAAGVSFSF